MADVLQPGPDAAEGRMRWLEPLAFAVLVLAHLLPLWLFRYVPTQDGPSHLANAVLLRDYGNPATHHHEFFALALELFPNWSAHLLLAGCSWLVHPLMAEKLLLTGYVVSFALACRYFLAAWPGGALLAPLCLLFVYNRCFFMGFYSYCLSLPLIFVILGLSARLPQRLSPWPFVALTGLFLLAYFTHLVGYVQAALGAVVLVLALPGCRWRRLLMVGVALLPSLVFCADYLTSSGLTFSLVADLVAQKLGGGQAGGGGFAALGRDLTRFQRDVFIPYQAGSIPIGLCWWLLVGAYAGAGLYRWLCSERGTACRPKPWLALLLFSLVMGALYVAAPDSFGKHGGFLKPRLAIVLPILWLALLRAPSRWWLKYPLLAANYALALALLICTCNHFAAANRVLNQYVAGLDDIGRNHVLYVIQSTHQEPYEVSYLLHASNYYCLDSGCTNLDNYEATAHYFPIRFRPGVPRGRGDRMNLPFYPRFAAVERVLAWEWPARTTAAPPPGFRLIFRKRSLTIYGRDAGGPELKSARPE